MEGYLIGGASAPEGGLSFFDLMATCICPIIGAVIGGLAWQKYVRGKWKEWVALHYAPRDSFERLEARVKMLEDVLEDDVDELDEETSQE